MTGRSLAASIFVGLTALGAFGGRAQAQTKCPAITGASPALADVDAETRLAFVRATMTDQAARAKTWTWAWSGIGFGLAAGQYALVALVQPNKRFEEAFGATANLYIPGSLALMPLRVREDHVTLEGFLAETESPFGPAAPCLRLERAEELMTLSAEDESLRTAWFQHVISIVLGAGYGAIYAVAFKDKGAMVLNGVGAIVLGEAQLLTAPTGAARALERYKRGEVVVPPAPPPVSFQLVPLVAAPGLALAGRF